MKKFFLSLIVLAIAGGALAQAPVINPGWQAFVIRDASDGTSGPPLILDNDVYVTDSVEMVVFAGGQKAGLGTDDINGATISQIATLHVDRLDDPLESGSLWGPYFNVWVTDGLGNYAVVANEPSNAEWGGDPWDVADWNDLKTKTCKVYEVAGWNTGLSWVHTYAGKTSGLIFEDIAGLIIEPPTPAYIAASPDIGSGAPDEIVTNVAYGYNWIFGDTMANYVSGNEGFVVNGYSATANFPVNNTTQGIGYTTIQAAVNGAVNGDQITIAAGTYLERPVVNKELTFVGADEATTIIDAGVGAVGGSYGFSVSANNVSVSNLTLVGDTGLSTPRYGFKPSGVSNFALNNVTAKEFYRTGVDLNGVTSGSLTDVVSIDNGGHGFALTDCHNVTVTSITASGNAWQGVSVATWGASYTLGTSGIVFNGTNSFIDPFQLEMGDSANPGVAPAGDAIITYSVNIGDGADVTFQSADYTFAVHGEQDDGPGQVRIWMAPDLATAALLPAVGGPVGHFTGNGIYLESLLDSTTMYVTPGCSIKAAIAAAPAGGTVDVASGTYVENGQIVVDKDVDIIGDTGTRPIVMTDQNTGSSDDARGWWLQTAGTTFVMENLELDGAGFDVYQGIRTTGNGGLVNCALRNIVYPGYGGVAIAAFGGDYWDVTDCTFDDIGRVGILNWTGGTFSGNTYTGKGPGDWLDYAVDTNAGAVMLIEGNTITACQGVATSDGSTSAALMVTTLYGPGTTATINDNILTGNTTGVVVGYDAVDASAVSGTGNDFSGNDSFGVENTGTSIVDFLGNWWGDASGPLHATLNPGGLGVPVGDNILFDPWTGMAGGGIVPVTTGPLNCSQTITLTFNFTADDYTPDMFLYNAVVSATPGLVFGAVADLEPFGTVNNNFFAMATGANQWTVTGSTVGSPSYPVTGAGTTGLFTITFSAAGDVAGSVVFDSLTLRDPANNTIPVVLTGATITYDCTAPAAVTAITAAPRHNKVDVSWTHDLADVDHFEVHRGMWYDTTVGVSAYPEYDDQPGEVIPTRPTGYGVFPGPAGEWVQVDGGAVTTVAFTDTWTTPVRGVYYYEVFAVDAAGNGSAVAAANDRATNYWLGDVYGGGPGILTPNGEIDVWDMNELGTSFGLGVPLDDPINILDVGPTDDWSRVGIPLTDNLINFEDLMVFSMNFGVVTPAKTVPPISNVIELAWVRYDDGRQALRLVDGTGVKGLNVRADMPVGGVTAGDLLDQQSELTFLKNVGGKLDVSVAVTGVNVGFAGSGDLFILDAEEMIDVDDLTIKVRGHDNSQLKFEMGEATGSLTPRVFALNPNYPNPFNPMTKISFSLPEAQDVRLAVYGIDGRLVATLLNESRGPGLHEVIWNGQDDSGRQAASGMYFYRIEAGPYSQVHKMTLMK